MAVKGQGVLMGMEMFPSLTASRLVPWFGMMWVKCTCDLSVLFLRIACGSTMISK